MAHLGDIIRHLREEANMGLREVAREARVDPSSLSKLERHQQHTLNPENLARVAQTLGTTAESLLAKVRDDHNRAADWPTFEEALARDRNLTEEQRDVILRLYRLCTRTRGDRTTALAV